VHKGQTLADASRHREALSAFDRAIITIDPEYEWAIERRKDVLGYLE